MTKLRMKIYTLSAILLYGISVSPIYALGASSTDTITYSGATEIWEVPAGVTSVYFQAWGAAGAGTSLGGSASGTLNVTAGQLYTICVGGAGTAGSAAAGGFCGGGAAGGGSSQGQGSGGGMTWLSLSPSFSGNTVIIVAGGGGGLAGGVGNAGGNAGGLIGST